MNNNMNIVSLSLPPILHERLLQTAKREGKSLSEYAREVFSRVLVEKDEDRLTRMYSVLRRSKGSGSRLVTDGSLTIDDTLYGDQGVWKGSDAS